METNLNEKFLPIGTVVRLHNVKKRFMITGFCAIAKNGNNSKVFDYSGCLFPEGFVNNNQTALFNHEQIDEVVHLGLLDEEDKLFKNKLNDMFECANYMSWGDVDNLVITNNVENDKKIEDVSSFNSFSTLSDNNEVESSDTSSDSLSVHGDSLNQKNDGQNDNDIDEEVEQSRSFYDDVKEEPIANEASLYPDQHNTLNSFMPQTSVIPTNSSNLTGNFGVEINNNDGNNHLNNNMNGVSYSTVERGQNSSLQNPLNSLNSSVSSFNTKMPETVEKSVQLDFSYKKSPELVQNADAQNNSHVNISRNKFLVE